MLRDDGTLWVNLGETRASGQGPHPLPPLNRMGIPERFALAMQSDGWIWRDSIVWAKPSPMPESVSGTTWQRCRVKVRGNLRGVGRGKIDSEDAMRLTQGFNVRWDAAQSVRAEGNPPHSDRAGLEFLPSAEWAPCPGCPKCASNEGWVLRRGSWRTTNSHEMIYMFVKGPGYYCDGEAVSEKVTLSTVARVSLAASRVRGGDTASTLLSRVDGYKRTNEARVSVDQYSDPRDHLVVRPKGDTRNRRSVWHDITPEPYSGGHYSTFPSDLPRICIQASTSEAGVCPSCGAQWARCVEGQSSTMNIRVRDAVKGRTELKWGDTAPASAEEILAYGVERPDSKRTVGWRPTCSCHPAPSVPALVLDPFVGTGTTCVAAQRLGRRSIGVDLSGEYLAQAVKRLTSETLPLPLATGREPGAGGGTLLT